MASIYQDKKSKNWIVDIYERGKVRVGKNKARAHEAYNYIGDLEVAAKSGLAPDSRVMLWVSRIPSGSYLERRLSELGLIAKKEVRTLSRLLDKFTDSRSKNKNSREFYRQVTTSLDRFFGSDREVSTVTEQEALAFKAWLLKEGRLVEHPTHGNTLSEATVARRIKGARQVFKLAMRNGWAPSRIGDDGHRYQLNPFENVKPGRQYNPDRAFFVEVSVAEKVIEHLPTEEFKLAFALTRYGGLRCPSELNLLRFSDIDLKRRAMRFRSPKTASYAGKEIRTCPIFVEPNRGIDLLSYFESYFASTDLRRGLLLPAFATWKHAGQMFTTIVRRAIKDAGFKPWEKLFGNCRASRASEVVIDHGKKNESEWIGHSEEVSFRHYQMQMNGDWERATGVKI